MQIRRTLQRQRTITGTQEIIKGDSHTDVTDRALAITEKEEEEDRWKSHIWITCKILPEFFVIHASWLQS